MTMNQLRASIEKRRAEFKRQCDDDPVQQRTCAGCNRLFETCYEYETHRVVRPGYYTNAGHLINGDIICPDDVYMETN